MIGALYMLRAMRNVCTVRARQVAGIADATNVWRKLPYALLLASLLVSAVFRGCSRKKSRPMRKRCEDGDGECGG